jgi:ribonuclease HI
MAEEKKQQVFYLFADGACRGNPGPSGAGFVIYNSKSEIIFQGSEYLGKCTNNVAEYYSLLYGLQAALKLDIKYLQVRMDSKLAVGQVSQNWKIKAVHLKPLVLSCQVLVAKFTQCELQHIPREENKVADALANEGVDKGLKIRKKSINNNN